MWLKFIYPGHRSSKTVCSAAGPYRYRNTLIDIAWPLLVDGWDLLCSILSGSLDLYSLSGQNRSNRASKPSLNAHIVLTFDRRLDSTATGKPFEISEQPDNSKPISGGCGIGWIDAYGLVNRGSGYKINRGFDNGSLHNKSVLSYFRRHTFPLLVLSKAIW